LRQARQLPFQIENEILSTKREHPKWGAPKVRQKLRRRIGSEFPLPAISTVHAALDSKRAGNVLQSLPQTRLERQKR